MTDFDDILGEKRTRQSPLKGLREQLEQQDTPWFDVGDALLAVPRGIAGMAQDSYGLLDAASFDALPDWEENPFGQSKSVAGSLIEGATNFAAGFIPVFGWLGRAGKVGRVLDLTTEAERIAETAGFLSKARRIGAARAVAAGAITDFTVFDGHEERLSNLVQSYPGLQNPVTEFLAADEDDPEIVGRLKNALEGAGVGLFVDALVAGVKAVKAGRRVRSQGGTPSDVQRAIDDAVPEEEFQSALELATNGPPGELPGPKGAAGRPQTFQDTPIRFTAESPDQGGILRAGSEAQLSAGDEGVGFAGQLDGGTVFDATRDYSKNPLWQQAQGATDRERLESFQNLLAGEGYQAILYPSGRLKTFTDLNVAPIERDVLAEAAAGKAGTGDMALEEVQSAAQMEIELTKAGDVDPRDAAKLRAGLVDKPSRATDDETVRSMFEESQAKLAPREENVGTRAGEPTPAAPREPAPRVDASAPPKVKVKSLLRSLGMNDESIQDLGRRVEERGKITAKAAVRENPAGVGTPGEVATTAVNPRKLDPASRLALELRPTDLNLEHYRGTEGALELLRTVDELFWNTMKEDVPNLASKTLDEQASLAMKEAVDISGAPSEQAFMAQVLRGLSADLRTAPRIAARIQGYRYIMAAQAERNYLHLKEIEALAKGEKVGNLEAALVKARENTEFLANVVAGVKGLVAEQGRALGGNRIDVGGLSLRNLDLPNDPAELARVLNESGGRDFVLKKVRQELIAYGDGGVEGAAALSKIARATVGQRAFNMTIEYWMNALLSGPKTLVVNVMGPMMASVYRPLEVLFGAGIQGALRSVQGDAVGAALQSDIMRSSMRQVMELATSFPEAWKAAKKMSMGGDNILDPRATVADAAGRGRAISSQQAGLDPMSTAGKSVDWIGRLVRLPTGVLSKSDEFVKQINYRAQARAELADQALKMGVPRDRLAAHVHDQMERLIWEGQAYSSRAVYKRGLAEARARGIQWGPAAEEFAQKYVKENFDENLSALSQRALAHAREVTFTTPAAPGSVSASLQRMIAQHPFLRLVLPFVNTPMNILKFTGQRIDAVGAARGLAALRFPEYARSLSDSKNRLVTDMLSNDPKRMADATGRLAAGASIATFVFAKASDGTITGRGPSDPEQRKTLMESGWQPYSIKVGNAYIGYNRMDPFATLIGTMADVMDYSRFANIEDQQTLETLGNGIMVAMANNFTNKSYLTGLANFIEALESPDKKMPTFVQRFASSFVPNLAGQAALPAGDDNMRDVRSIMDAAVAKVPGLSSTLPPQRNVLGEPVKRVKSVGSESVSRWVDWFNPIAYREVSDSVVKNEMAALGHAFTGPKRSVNGVDLSDVALSSGQTAYDRWGELHGTVKVNGMTLKDALRREIKSKSYQVLSPLSTGEHESPRVQRLTSIIRAYRERAYQQLLRESPELAAHEKAFLQQRRQLRAGIDTRTNPQ